MCRKAKCWLILMDKVFSGEKFFRSWAGRRLCFGKEACRGLCWKSEVPQNTLTNHPKNKSLPPDYYDAAARDWGVYPSTKRITTARALQQCVDQEVYVSRRFWLHLEISGSNHEEDCSRALETMSNTLSVQENRLSRIEGRIWTNQVNGK
jgi:hypothetical protein